MGVPKRLFAKILGYPREVLVTIDEKVGIEIFKLAMVFSTVYFVQGMGGLSNIPLLFYFKNVLKFTEDQVQNFGAITMFAWLIKPLFGYISDRFPICGYRRKSYMILMAMVAAFSWWILAWMVANGYSQYTGLVLVFNFSSLGYAFVDVVCDGLMVERGQALKKEDIFVNIQWFALGIAGFLAGVCGGQLQHAVKTGAIALPWVFMIVGVIPLTTSLIAWLFINEEKIKRAAKSESEKSPEQKVDFSLIKEILSSRIFWLLSAFIFFWKYSPSFGAVYQYYSIDIMKFDELFLGKIEAIGNAIFPLSILLYGGMLKYLSFVKTKHYLYGSVVVGLIYSAISLLFYLPESAFSWVRFALPFGDRIIVFWVIPLLIFLVVFSGLVYWLIRKRIAQYNLRRSRKGLLSVDARVEKRISALDRKIGILGKTRFCAGWIIILPLSLLSALWFANSGFSPFVLSYRSLTVLDGVIFGYASIASFLIPLALAAKLAPKKVEGMTYAYFMALSNLSSSFLPSITGAQMFKVLKRTLLHPETVIAANLWHSLLIVVTGICLAAAIIVSIILIIRMAGNIARGEYMPNRVFYLSGIIGCLIIGGVAAYYFAPTFLIHVVRLKSFPVYLVQRSYFAMQSIIGNADWLGKDAFRALILRYATIIGAIFTAISTIFVFLLKIPREDKK